MPDQAFLVLIGIMLIILGFFFIVSGMMRSANERVSIPHKEIKSGGIILIGPVPIVFGNDKKYVIPLMILALVLMLLAMLFLKWT
jgi:uncharacterized protein (TIGR00304 family)